MNILKYLTSSNLYIICSWLPELELARDVGTVDLSLVVCATQKGTGMINHKRRCFLCGQKNGLKMLCDVAGCCYKMNESDEKLVMHVSCARQAGLEVRVDDERVNDKGGPLAYGKLNLSLQITDSYHL